jgi:hypothetical protein
MGVHHGLAKTRFYTIWKTMKARCYRPSIGSSYLRYGGRGIKVSKRWHTFNNFKRDMYQSYLRHASLHGESNTSLDTGNYQRNNCQWSTREIQNLNRGLLHCPNCGYQLKQPRGGFLNGRISDIKEYSVPAQTHTLATGIILHKVEQK